MVVEIISYIVWSRISAS